MVDSEGYFSELARPEPEPLDPTAAELRALTFTSHGLTAEECADAMNCHRSTVEKCLADARKKLGAKTTVHSVAIALRLGLID